MVQVDLPRSYESRWQHFSKCVPEQADKLLTAMLIESQQVPEGARRMTVLGRSAQHAVKQIQPGLWQIVFHLPAPTNCWLWQEYDGLTLVDAGFPWSTEPILD